MIFDGGQDWKTCGQRRVLHEQCTCTNKREEKEEERHLACHKEEEICEEWVGSRFFGRDSEGPLGCFCFLPCAFLLLVIPGKGMRRFVLLSDFYLRNHD
jgi:hypothetical protein